MKHDCPQLGSALSAVVLDAEVLVTSAVDGFDGVAVIEADKDLVDTTEEVTVVF